MSGIRDFGQSLVSGVKDVRTWVGDNIVGQDDPYSTRQSVRSRDYAVLGASTGAVAGCAVGVITGFNSQGKDSIKEQWVHRDVQHPELHGYNHWISADTYQECHTEGYGENRHEVCHTETRGWWHHFSPNIRNRDVGDYQEPQFVHQSKWEPLLGGFLGAMGGALVGLGVGIGIAALQNAIESKDGQAPTGPSSHLTQEQRKDLSDFAGGAALVGTVAGAGLGAFVGSRAGAVELGQQEVHVRNWLQPTTQNSHLGDIPRDYYEYNWGWGWPSGGEGSGRTGVYRHVPVYDSTGRPTFHEVTKEFKTNRYGPLAGGILGGFIGAGIGLASGVAVGVGAKLIAEHKAEKAAEKTPLGLAA